jgi:tRNA dimethylallyltransferase
VRALEVIFSTGVLFSAQRSRGDTPYCLLQIGLIRERPELYRRIDERIDGMISGGFKEEVQNLLDQGYSPELNTLSAIGYREMIAHVRGEMSLEEAVIQMKRLTRRYVRQQSNWFRRGDENIHWYDARDGVEIEICALIAGTFQ